MNMGRERGILRWELHHALLAQRLARVEETLAGLAEPKGVRERERLEQLTREREDLQCKLQALGPSPSAKMG
jgi:hypothetical protein